MAFGLLRRLSARISSCAVCLAVSIAPFTICAHVKAWLSGHIRGP